MSKVTISVCDICLTEQRSDTDVYWAMKFGGPCVVDLKNQPGSQYKKTFETLCSPCARRIADAVMEAIEWNKAVDKNGAAE